MQFSGAIFLALLVVHLFVIKIEAFNILLFLIGTNQFERSTFEYLAQQLARRYHTTITVKPILIPEEPRLVQPRLHLVHEKLLKDLLPRKLYLPLQMIGGDVPWRKTYEYEAFDEPYWKAHNYACEKILNSNLMEVIARDNIDVAILYSGNPCQLAIVHALKIPFIYFDTHGLTDETRLASGMEWPSTMESSLQIFRRRFQQFHLIFCEFVAQNEAVHLLRAFSCPKFYTELDAAITKTFALDYDIKNKFRDGFPTVNEIKQNAELYFVNTDVLLEPFQSIPPNVVPVAGLHIDHVKPLFSPWNNSIAEAKHGVIVVSFGSQVDTTKMPVHFVKALLNSFSKFSNYRIFWKIGPKLKLAGIEDLENGTIPAHINITTFIPQNELLASRRTRLFITNGGMHSIIEGMAHGIPILGIPLYGTNRENLAKVQRIGFGLTLEKNRLNEKTLTETMHKLLNNPKFMSVARELSRNYQNRPSDTFQNALFMIEHVARYRSAKFLRNPAMLEKWKTFPQKLFALFIKLNLDIWLIVIASIAVFYMLLKVQIFLISCMLDAQRLLVCALSVLSTPNKEYIEHFYKPSKAKNSLRTGDECNKHAIF